MKIEFVKEKGLKPELLCRIPARFTEEKNDDSEGYIIGYYTNMGGDREYILDVESDVEPPIYRLYKIKPEAPISRCTGVTDKNGNYIFEHDVLKNEISWMDDGTSETVYSTVVYWRGEWMLYENCMAIDTCADLWSSVDEVEVTGNVNFIEVEQE